jgi:hypothetical protein
MAIREAHEAMLIADERVKEAQGALDQAIREHWMASQARVKAEEEYYNEVKVVQAKAIERLEAKFGKASAMALCLAGRLQEGLDSHE